MAKVTIVQILTILVLADAAHLIRSQKYPLLSDPGIFPDDDVEWLSVRKYNNYDDENLVYRNDYKVCDTPDCKKVAEEFLSSMNKSVEPCNDFYEFACGGWSTKSPIPPSLPNWSRFTIFEHTVKHRIKETLERRSIEPIESIVLQTGGWPIAMDDEEWDEEESWQNVDRHYSRLMGSYVFYELDGEYRIDDAEFGEINILPSELPLSERLPLNYRDYDGNNYETYVRFVEEVVELFVQRNRAVVSKRRVKREVEKLVEFEKEINKLKHKTGYSTFLTFDEFIAWYDSNMTEMNADPKTKISWKSVIIDLFATVNINVDPSTKLYLSNMAYIEGIPVLLKRTPIRTIVNYIHWKFVANMLIYTTENIRNRFSTLMMEEVYGVKERPPRWLECVDDMKMTHAAAYAFVDKFFTKSTETAAVEMVGNIRVELEANINESDWLDEESKVILKDKLGAMKILIGFPDWYWNRTAVTNYYKGLTIGTGYFDNILTNIRYDKKQKLKRYMITKEKASFWYMDPITVNAMYFPNDNALNIPAVDFQSPLFTQGLPDSVNYGVVGVLIGHEMGHAFDDCAIRFGKEGDDTELSENILASYYERAECFIGQFNEYYGKAIAPIERPWSCKDSKESEGERTAAENIADTTGLQAVFQAYKRVAEKKSDQKTRLPGLEEFTDEQLFFISFADMWCEIDTPKFAEIREQAKDVHSPVRLRVIGALSNMKDFARVFNCPVDSLMNPIDKCDIWMKSEAK